MALFDELPLAEEKDMLAVFSVAEFIFRVCITCRREGLLALEDFFENDSPLPFSEDAKPIIKRIAAAIVNGEDDAYLSDLAHYSLGNYFAQNNLASAEKLSLIMAAEGLLAIKNGKSPDSIKTLFEAMAGETVGKRLSASLKNISDAMAEKNKKQNAEREKNIRPINPFLKSNASKSFDSVRYPASLKELKDELSERISQTIERAHNERALLRNLIISVCEQNNNAEARLHLGEYGLEEDTIKSLYLHFLEKTRIDRDFSIDFFSKEDGNVDLVCSDERLAKAIDALDFSEYTLLGEKLSQEKNPVLLTRLDNNILSFDDVVLIDDLSIQKITMKIIAANKNLIATALYSADENVQDKILRNLSSDIHSETEKKLSEYTWDPETVFYAQKEFLKIIRPMIDSGEIALMRGW